MWIILAIIAAIVFIVKLTQYKTTETVTRLLSKELSKEMLLKMESHVHEETERWRDSIESDRIAGFYSNNFHTWLKESRKTMAIIKTIQQHKQ